MEVREAFIKYLMEQGIDKVIAELMADRLLSENDVSDWSEEQIFDLLDSAVTEIQAARGVVQPDADVAPPVQPLGDVTPPQPQDVSATTSLDELLAGLGGGKANVSQVLRQQIQLGGGGVPEETIARWAETLESYDYGKMSDPDKKAYVRAWIPQQIQFERATGFTQREGEERRRASFEQRGLGAVAPFETREDAALRIQTERFTRQTAITAERRQGILGVLSVGEKRAGLDRTAAAFERTRAETWRRLLGSPPTAQSLISPIVSGLRETISPAAERFFRGKLPSELAALAPARQAWWQRVSQTPERGKSEGTRRIGFAESKEQALASDPWAQFLASQNFRERFRGLAPEERGFRVSQFRPRTRRLSTFG